MATNVVVKQVEDRPVDIEVLAESIVKISKASEALFSSGLKQSTLVVLLHDITKVRKTDIEYVLNALPELRRRYTTR